MRKALIWLVASFLSAFAVLAQNPIPPQEAPQPQPQPQPTQTSLAGTYEVLDQCDQPLDAPNIYRIHFVPIIGTPFLYAFMTYEGFDAAGQSTGIEVIDDKELTYMVAPGEDCYLFESVSGETTGRLTPSDEGFVMDYDGNQPNHLRPE